MTKTVEELKEAVSTDDKAEVSLGIWLGKNRLAMHFSATTIQKLMENFARYDLHPSYVTFIGYALIKIARDSLGDSDIYGIPDMSDEDRKYLNQRTMEGIRLYVEKAINFHNIADDITDEEKLAVLQALKSGGEDTAVEVLMSILEKRKAEDTSEDNTKNYIG